MNLSGCDKVVLKNSISGSRFVVSPLKYEETNMEEEKEVEKERRRWRVRGGGREGEGEEERERRR